MRSASFQISMSSMSSIQLQLSSNCLRCTALYNECTMLCRITGIGRQSFFPQHAAVKRLNILTMLRSRIEAGLRKSNMRGAFFFNAKSLCNDYAEHHPTPIIGSLVRASCLKQDRKSYQWKATARVCHNHPHDSSLSLIIPSWVPHDSLWILHDFR